jgi:hypothetical protein
VYVCVSYYGALNSVVFRGLVPFTQAPELCTNFAVWVGHVVCVCCVGGTCSVRVLCGWVM